MKVSRSRLLEILTAAMPGSGSASLSVIETPGADPETVWIPDTVGAPAFLAYSITKTFTASLVLKLCDQGKLHLADALVNWFPRLPQVSHVTLYQLLNHTAGIPDYGGIAAYHDAVRLSPSEPWSPQRFATETFERGLLFRPGTGWAYSNVGYMLLKQILERVSGVGYGTLVAELIARPLGLTRTYVAESIADLAELAPSFSSRLAADGSLRDVRACYHPGWVSHGVVAATTSDIVRFIDSLFAGRLLSADSLGRMLELVPLPAVVDQSASGESPLRPRRPGYGLGVMGDPESPWGTLVGHNGGGPGYGASALHAVDLGSVSVCAMGSMEEGFDAVSVIAQVLDDHLSRS